MTQYMLLIYSPQGYWQSAPEEERNETYQEYYKLSEDLDAENRLVISRELEPAGTATTVRIENGNALIVDGPYAETKEALGGFYLIEADSQEDALRWAQRIPSARRGHGLVEVRQVVGH